MKIISIHARQILDSRGTPTVETDVILEDGQIGRASVPSGASTGLNEAIELRDQDPKIYLGKSVLKAVKNVNSVVAAKIIGQDVQEQEKIDQLMIDLDGTENKSNLGANAVLSVSLACAHAAAKSQKIQLYQYISYLNGNFGEYLLPLPMINIVNGGKHGSWVTDFQEYMILPISANSFTECLQMGAEVFQNLKKVLTNQGYSNAVGDEGGFSPIFKNSNTKPFELISQAIDNAGYKLGKDFVFGLDAAASQLYKDSNYYLKSEGRNLNSNNMTDWYLELIKRYPIVSLEDALDQNDWEGWIKLTSKLGQKVQVVGDDLLVTNIKFLQKAIDKKACNAILVKVNQIGTLTETIKVVEMAKNYGFNVIISHRSGETEDTTISHLAVGLKTGQIKTGSLSRTDRIAKYNELLRIEEHLGENARFSGTLSFKK